MTAISENFVHLFSLTCFNAIYRMKIILNRMSNIELQKKNQGQGIWKKAQNQAQTNSFTIRNAYCQTKFFMKIFY